LYGFAVDNLAGATDGVAWLSNEFAFLGPKTLKWRWPPAEVNVSWRSDEIKIKV
jgi:hypothetical protein